MAAHATDESWMHWLTR